MRIPVLFASLVLATHCVAAEAAPKQSKVDFTIPLVSLGQNDPAFSSYRNRWTLVFYFLPTCGHCQQAYPALQRLRTNFERKGLAVAAIVSGSAPREDIRQFDEDFKLDMPVFQDASRRFSQEYGAGSVPLLLLVGPDGAFQRWVGFNERTESEIEAAVRSGLHVR